MDYARALMESPARSKLQFPDARQVMTMEYALARPGGGGGGLGGGSGIPEPSGGGGGAGEGRDWMCDMCQASNFGRWGDPHSPANSVRATFADCRVSSSLCSSAVTTAATPIAVCVKVGPCILASAPTNI